MTDALTYRRLGSLTPLLALVFIMLLLYVLLTLLEQKKGKAFYSYLGLFFIMFAGGSLWIHYDKKIVAQSLEAPDAITTFLTDLGSMDDSVRDRAIIALAKLKDARAIPGLLVALDDHNDDIVACALYGIVELKAKVAVPKILPLLTPGGNESVLHKSINELIPGDIRFEEYLQRQSLFESGGVLGSGRIM